MKTAKKAKNTNEMSGGRKVMAKVTFSFGGGSGLNLNQVSIGGVPVHSSGRLQLPGREPYRPGGAFDPDVYKRKPSSSGTNVLDYKI